MTSRAMPFDRHRSTPDGSRRTWLETAEFCTAVLAVFFAPINYLRLNVAYITLSDAFIVLCVVLTALNGRLPLRPLGKATNLWFGSLLLFTGGLMVSSVMVGDPATGAIVTSQYVFAYALVPLCILGRSERDITILIVTFVASMVFVTIHGAYHINFTDGPSPFVSGNGRLRSLVERTNETASLVAFAIVLALWLYLARRLSGVLAIIAIAILGYGLVLTGSNTGFLLTCAGMVLLAVLSGSMRFSLALVALGTLAAVATVIWGESFLPKVFVDRVLVALQTGDPLQAGTFAGRLLLMREAVTIADDSIVLGLGADQYRHVSVYSAPVHNVYLLVLAEGGLVALVGFTGLILSLVYLGWSGLNDPRLRLGGAITLTITAMFAACMAGIPHCYARFWVVPVILAASASLAGVSSRSTIPGRTAELFAPGKTGPETRRSQR
jgi:O-antigen ligase